MSTNDNKHNVINVTIGNITIDQQSVQGLKDLVKLDKKEDDDYSSYTCSATESSISTVLNKLSERLKAIETRLDSDDNDAIEKLIKEEAHIDVHPSTPKLADDLKNIKRQLDEAESPTNLFSNEEEGKGEV